MWRNPSVYECSSLWIVWHRDCLLDYCSTIFDRAKDYLRVTPEHVSIEAQQVARGSRYRFARYRSSGGRDWPFVSLDVGTRLRRLIAWNLFI